MINHPPILVRRAERAAQALVSQIDGNPAVVVATPDGFDLAHAGQRMIDPKRLAAVVSSLAALGDAACRETELGVPFCLVIESGGGWLVARRAQVLGEAVVMLLLADKTVMLGLLLHHLTAAERLMNASS